MNNQKNRFWTFCFSLVPGAGEMYFGMYRCGASLMLSFFLVLMVPLLMDLAVLALLAVILWFYSFLHVHNLRAMPVEEFQALEDRCIWEGQLGKARILERHRTGVAIGLIVVGGYLLLEQLLRILSWAFYYDYLYYMPRLLISALIIALGVWLIRGKKQELTQEEPEVPLSAPAAQPAKPGEPAPAQTAENAEESQEVPHESA